MARASDARRGPRIPARVSVRAHQKSVAPARLTPRPEGEPAVRGQQGRERGEQEKPRDGRVHGHDAEPARRREAEQAGEEGGGLEDQFLGKSVAVELEERGGECGDDHRDGGNLNHLQRGALGGRWPQDSDHCGQSLIAAGLYGRDSSVRFETMSHEKIYAVVRRIPCGRVATYGQVAELAGLAGHARQVGYAMAALPSASAVPWQRVINAAGMVSRGRCRVRS